MINRYNQSINYNQLSMSGSISTLLKSGRPYFDGEFEVIDDTTFHVRPSNTGSGLTDYITNVVVNGLRPLASHEEKWLIDIETSIIDRANKISGVVDGKSLTASRYYHVYYFFDNSFQPYGYGLVCEPKTTVSSINSGGTKGTITKFTVPHLDGWAFTVGARVELYKSSSEWNYGTVTNVEDGYVYALLDNESYGSNLSSSDPVITNLEARYLKPYHLAKSHGAEKHTLITNYYVRCGSIYVDSSSHIDWLSHSNLQGQMLFFDRATGQFVNTETDELFWDDTNKRFGIGTSSPSELLHVDGNASLDGSVVINDSGADVDFRVEGDSDPYLIRTNANLNRVAIGHSWPDAKLHVHASTGNALATTGGDVLINYDYEELAFTIRGHGSGEYFEVNTDGEVSMPAVYSDTVGATNRDLYIDNTGKLGYDSSSIRHKKNVRDAGVGGKVYELKVKRFDFKNKEKGKNRIGLIAEEVEKIFPEVVSYDDDGQPECIVYTRLVPILVDAVVDLNNRLKALEGK